MYYPSSLRECIRYCFLLQRDRRLHQRHNVFLVIPGFNGDVALLVFLLFER